MRRVAESHRTIVLEVLRRHGPLSAEQVSDRLGGALDTLQVMKRLVELVRMGSALRTEDLHRNRSGRWASRYDAVRASPCEARGPVYARRREVRLGDVELPPEPQWRRHRRRWTKSEATP